MSSDQSANLALPYLAAAQAQKHVTHNEALRRLDVFAQLTLDSVSVLEPPAVPTEGARWFVPTGASGAFAGQEGQIAAYEAGAFDFLAVPADAVAYVRDENRFARFDGAGWVSPLADRVGELSALSALVLESATALEPPAAPEEGLRWFVPAGATGTFAGQAGQLALAAAAGFAFLPMPEGALAYIRDEDRLARYDGADWIAVTSEAAAPALGQLILESASASAPPASPGEGARWFVPTGGSGAFLGQAGMVATFSGGTFSFEAPQAGLLAFIRDQWRVALFDGGAWVSPLAVRPTRAAIEAEVIEEDVILIGASTNTSAVIPARAIVLGVSTRTLSGVTGATSYDCGIAGETSKFGGSLGIALGSSNSGVIGPTAFYAATPVRLTANGGSFTGGRVRVSIHVLKCPAAAFPNLETAWWSAAGFLLDGTAPQLAADFVAERYAISGAHLSSGDLLTRSGGVKTVQLPSGTTDQAPANGLAFDYDAGYRRLLLEGTATNLFIGNAAPTAAQNITVTAQAYTLSFVGTGTITLSGAASGTVSVGSGAVYAKYTFTPAAGTLTLTPSGDVRLVQLEVGSLRTSTITTTSSAVTRVTDICQWTAGAAATLGTTATLCMRGLLGNGLTSTLLSCTNTASNTNMATANTTGNLFVRAPGSAEQVSSGISGATEAGLCFGFNGAGTVASANGNGPGTSATALPAGTTSAVFLGASTGISSRCRIEIAQLLVWPVKGTSAAVLGQAHVYTA